MWIVLSVILSSKVQTIMSMVMYTEYVFEYFFVYVKRHPERRKMANTFQIWTLHVIVSVCMILWNPAYYHLPFRLSDIFPCTHSFLHHSTWVYLWEVKIALKKMNMISPLIHRLKPVKDLCRFSQLCVICHGFLLKIFLQIRPSRHQTKWIFNENFETYEWSSNGRILQINVWDRSYL